jgi:O-6-methylguanine DNA methyltransferase
MDGKRTQAALTAIRVGQFWAHYSEQGLARLEFHSPSGRRRASGFGAQAALALRRWHAVTERAVARVMAGRTPGELPPLDLTSGTTFQQEVWQALLTIPPGQTRTYTEIARQVGRPKAVRAVGRACGANPIPVLIPCHRVIRSNGQSGGYSAGTEWKRRLLAAEGKAA